MRLNSGTPVPDERHRDGEERLGGRRAVHRPGAAGATRRSAKLRNGAEHRSDRHRDRPGRRRSAAARPRRWSTASATPGCRSCCTKRSTRSTASGPELARLIQSARLLVDEANANYRAGLAADRSGRARSCEAQIRGGDDIRSLADGLARFTARGRQRRPAAASTRWQPRPARPTRPTTTFSGIRPSFPVLAANLANLGRVGVIYHKSIEQLAGGLPGADGRDRPPSPAACPQDEGGKLDFKIDLQRPAAVRDRASSRRR